MKNETYPVFPALINAIHRGVAVRIITNDYGLADCDGTITMLQYLKLAGAEVRYFTTVTFVHAKYTSVDGGRRSAVSSINWSKASTTKNREAGAILEGDGLSALTSYMQGVFEFDWAQAYPLVPSDTWSSADLATITDSADLAVVLPDIDLYPGLYETPSPSPLSAARSNVTVQASPDSAWDTLEAALARATTSLEVAMYQVTTDGLCDQILDLANSGVNVSLLVSSRIYDEGDCEDAQACYSKLYSGGLRFRKTSLHYSYSHNKYWIVDGKEVGWSTGNWSPSDYPDHSNTYPPYGSDDWWKTNRDFTVYTDSAATVQVFQNVLWNDWYAPAAYDWEPEYDIYCGY